MQKRNTRKYSKKTDRNSSSIVVALVAVMVVLISIALCIRFLLQEPAAPAQVVAETEPAVEAEQSPSFWERLFGPKETLPPETEPTMPEPEHVVAEAVISATGDILMHKPVINTGLLSDGAYKFDTIFRYLKPFSSEADYAVANLETTLSGSDAGYQYSGYPAFNCPDAIVDALKNAGFDMLLTANNHCYDTSEYGFLRTVNTVRGRGLDVLGTRAAADEPVYSVKDINGIKIGMVCYTYEGPPEKPVAGTVYMNMNALSPTCGGLINSFLPGQLDPFYLEARQIMDNMKKDGAEATVFFIHWGEEYQTVPNAEQQAIAQQLCDLGFDVIIGGHPHVIQPVDLLTSRLNPEHKTVCLYSTGNAVSNQRISEMNLKTGHTEDGLLFSIKFTKYSDDTVYLDSAQLLPCWVDLRTNITNEYVIIPLDAGSRNQWQELYGLSSAAFDNAVKSYDRTVALTGTGMNLVQNYLTNQREQRDADYLAAVTAVPDAA